eukprot:3028703-Rhodomonas_salina.1
MVTETEIQMPAHQAEECNSDSFNAHASSQPKHTPATSRGRNATLMERRKKVVISPVDLSVITPFKSKQRAELAVLSAPATHVRLCSTVCDETNVRVHHCLDIRTHEFFLHREQVVKEEVGGAGPSLKDDAVATAVVDERSERMDAAERTQTQTPGELSEHSIPAHEIEDIKEVVSTLSCLKQTIEQRKQTEEEVEDDAS